MSTTEMTLTATELAGVEQFKASIPAALANPFQASLRLKMLRDGSVAKMPNAPRQEVIDVMIALCVDAGIK